MPTWIRHTFIATIVLAGLSTVGDWYWATYLPTHETVYGMVHGALLCLAIGVTLAGLAGGRRALVEGAIGLTLVGLVAAGSFYLLFGLVGWTAMFLSWMLLFLLTALLDRRWRHPDEPHARTVARGLIAAVASGLAFYAISGIWLSPDPTGPHYPGRLVRWCLPFLAGFRTLVRALAGSRQKQLDGNPSRGLREVEP